MNIRHLKSKKLSVSLTFLPLKINLTHITLLSRPTLCFEFSLFTILLVKILLLLQKYLYYRPEKVFRGRYFRIEVSSYQNVRHINVNIISKFLHKNYSFIMRAELQSSCSLWKCPTTEVFRAKLSFYLLLSPIQAVQ